MTKEEIKELFMQGIDCSQVVAGRFADELEMEESLLRKMSACFGGGMQCGETCGAVTGALDDALATVADGNRSQVWA